jgi:hypothetical protein
MALPPHLKDMAARVSNWGRWGDDDQREDDSSSETDGIGGKCIHSAFDENNIVVRKHLESTTVATVDDWERHPPALTKATNW